MTIDSHFDSLPYLDDEPTEEEVREINLLILKEAGSFTHPHHDIGPEYTSTHLSQSMEDYIKGPREPGIDLSRYTELNHTDKKQVRLALAYADDRYENLTLLSEYGKNQWLISNDFLDQDLKLLSTKVEEERMLIDSVNAERRQQQLDIQTTYSYLENRWKESLRNVVDVNIACLELEAQKQTQSE